MEVVSSIVQGDPLSPTSRPPLAPRNNSASPASIRQIRRKASICIRRDSSDEIPSPHGSIFEAFRYSNKNSEDDGYDASSSLPATGQENNLVSASPIAMEIKHEEVDDGAAGSPDTATTDFLYGRGTLLETITEQKSIATMNTTLESLTENSPMRLLLNHRDSFVIAKDQRRNSSLSLDDLTKISRSYHEACTLIEGATRTSFEIHETYAKPKSPVNPPLKRFHTPPGMPSWTAAQIVARTRQESRSIRRPSFLQRLLGTQTSGDYTDVRNRSFSEPLAPRFRPPRTVYSQLHSHPFMTASTAKIDPFPRRFQVTTPTRTGILGNTSRDSDRQGRDSRIAFSLPATAQQSEIIALENTPASRRTDLISLPSATASLERQQLCSHQRRRADRSAQSDVIPANTMPLSIEYATLPASSSSARSTLLASHALMTRPSIISGQLPHSVPTTDNNAHLVCRPPGINLSTPDSNHHPLEPITPGSISTQLFSPSPLANLSTQAALGQTSTSATCWRCDLRTRTQTLKTWLQTQGHKFCFHCCGWDFEDVSEQSEAANVLEMRETDGFDTGRISRRMRGVESVLF